MLNDDDLRRLLNSDPPAGEGPAGECPDADELWALCLGELRAARVEPILQHALDCEPCREALAAARRGVAGAAEAPLGGVGRFPTRRRYLAVAAAVAAVLLLAVTLPRLGDGFGRQTGAIRGQATEPVWVAPADGRPLPRDAFELRWQPIPGAVTYGVDVLSGDLELLDRSGRLEEPAYAVGPGVLDAVAPGGPVLWRVQARLESGELLTSPVFRTTLAR